MNIHEYQAKEIYRKYGIPVPQGIPVFDPEKARASAEELIAQTGSQTVVVKAQIHAGGRGKAGGVKVVKGAEAAEQAARALFSKTLVTHQTGPEGKVVQRVLIEQGLDITRELYLALVLDRETRRVAVMASSEGGVEIEEVAEAHPEKIFRAVIDPITGIMPYQCRNLGFALGLEGATLKSFSKLLTGMVHVFVKEDCSIVEINPLIVTGDGSVLALDAKVNFDENAAFRHPVWAELRDLSEEAETEVEAQKEGLSFIQLDGNIGCLVNGAGLAMATMDIIKHYGGEPANFLDVGGGASQEAVTKAFEIILKSPSVKGIFVNIFGGIMRCDIIAEGVLGATKALGLKVPLVVRLEGTKAAEGKAILAESGLAVTPVSTMSEGAERIVALVGAA